MPASTALLVGSKKEGKVVGFNPMSEDSFNLEVGWLIPNERAYLIVQLKLIVGSFNIRGPDQSNEGSID